MLQNGDNMSQILLEQELAIPRLPGNENILTYLARIVHDTLEPDTIPIRFVVTSMDENYYYCENCKIYHRNPVSVQLGNEAPQPGIPGVSNFVTEPFAAP